MAQSNVTMDLHVKLSSRSARATPLIDLESLPFHLKCSACFNLHVNSFQTPHGCRLCERCVLDKLQLHGKRRLCPCSLKDEVMDEDVIRERLVRQTDCLPDMAARRELLDLMVHCPNSNAGCEMQMKWKDVEQHLNSACNHEIVVCDQCSKNIVQHKMQSSHRNLQSDECCPNFQAHCPQCGDSNRRLNRQEFAEHQKTCPSGQADCKYACVGCMEALKRCQLSEHYSSCVDEHLEQTVKRLQLELMTVQARLSSIEAISKKEISNLLEKVRHLEQELTSMKRAEQTNARTTRHLRGQPSAEAQQAALRHDSASSLESVHNRVAMTPPIQDHVNSLKYAEMDLAAMTHSSGSLTDQNESPPDHEPSTESSEINQGRQRWNIRMLYNARNEQLKMVVNKET